MGKSKKWHEKFFTELYGQVLSGQFSQERNLSQARMIKRALGLRKGKEVLDCPCGMGRITLALAGMGVKMTGADLTELYLKRARRLAKKRRLKIEFVRSDMRRLPFDGRFDAVINWFGSFGYFDDADNLATARAALAALKPGGKFLIESLNKSWLLSHFHAGHDDTISGVRIVNKARWNARTNRIHDTWTLSRGSKKQRHNIAIRVYDGGDIRALLREAGFTDIRLWAHTPKGLKRFTRHSRRYIVTARRSER